jgi:hypothetical protein
MALETKKYYSQQFRMLCVGAFLASTLYRICGEKAFDKIHLGIQIALIVSLIESYFMPSIKKWIFKKERQ